MALIPYKLLCGQPPLSDAYGPPDFYVLQPGCPEDSLDEKTLKEGYKETAVNFGITEDAESLLTHTGQNQAANAKLLEGSGIAGIRAELLKTLRDVFSTQLEKTKDSLQYDVVISGPNLTSPELIVPPFLDCSQEVAHFWLQDLAGTRPLRYMAHGVPALLARQHILRVFLAYQIPVPRAIWCLKMLMANQYRRGTQPPSAAEQTTPFTKMILEQLEQQLLDPDVGVAPSANTPLPPVSPLYDPTQSSPDPTDPTDVARSESEGAALSSGVVAPSADDGPVRLKYLTRLMVGCAAEGLLDFDEVVGWSARLLGITGAPEGALDVVHNLLQTCMEHICTSPIHTRTLAERLTEVAAQQVAKGESTEALRAVCHTLLQLVVTNPSSLLPLDCLPQLCDLLQQQACTLIPKLAPTVVEYASRLRAQSAALALSVTPPRTLGLSDSVAMQRLYRALAAADAEAGAAVLQDYMGAGIRVAGCSPIQEGVSLVCEWAVGDMLRCVDPSMLAQPAAGHSRPQCRDKRLSADQSACMLFALQLLRDLLLTQNGKTQRLGWVMQEAVFNWLDGRLGCGVESGDKTASETDVRNVVSLLLLLVEIGFFSPELYLTQLLSMGILTQTAGKPPCNNESELQRAQRHRRYLQCLHPELLQQPGPYSMAPTTPELAEEPLPVSATAKSRWSKSIQDYARDRKSALSIVPSNDPSQPPGTKPAIAVKEEDGVFQPPAKRQRIAEPSATATATATAAATASAKPVHLEAVYMATLASLGFPVPSNAVNRVESGELPSNILDVSGLRAQFGESVELSQLGLLTQISGLRVWQQRKLGAALKGLVEQRLRSLGCKDLSLSDWLDGLKKDLPSPSSHPSHSPTPYPPPPAGSLTSCLPSGDMWLLRALSLLVACDYSSAAVELLVKLLELYMQDRVYSALAEQACTRKEPAGGGLEARPAWSVLKIHEGTVIAALDALQDRVAAMGVLPRLLDTATSWGFKYNVSPLKGRQYFARLIQYAGNLLGTYWDSPVCKGWWSKFQKCGQPQAANSQHWLVGDLEALASQGTPSFGSTAKGTNSLPQTGPLVMPLVGLLPKFTTQRWLQKLSTSLKSQVEAAANNNRTCLQIINRTASCDNADGIMELTAHVSNALATWCGCGHAHVDEDLVVASIAGLLRNYVKLNLSAPALGASNESNPFHPTPASISKEAHIRCICELKGTLLDHHFNEAEVLVPHALLAGAVIVLKELGFSSKSGSAEAAVVGNTISILLGAVAHGLVCLVDVLNYLLAPGQIPEPVQLLCRSALMGNTCCRPHGWTGHGALTHLDLGASFIIESLQQRLSVDTVWLNCEELFRKAIFGVAKEPELQVMRNVLGHKPARRALLSDPRVLYQRLCASALALLPLDRVQQSLTLPARLMAVCILAGDVVQLRHCRPLLDGEYDVQQMALLASAAPHTLDLHWLLLRLMMDEQVLSQAIRVDRKVPKLALETAQAAFAETNKDREKDRSECSQVDKNFCEVLLISLLQRAHFAVLWAELAWQLGKAIGDYLLMRFYVILQDRTRELLSGTKSVAQKLLDMAEARKKQTDLTRTSSDQEAGAQGKSDWSGQVDTGMLQFSATAADPFSVEQALADLVLVGLTKSNTQLRTKIAAELVRQLGMVAELLKGLPVTSMEQLLLLLSQQTESRMDDGGELTPLDALSAGAAASVSEAGVALTSQGSIETASTVRRRSFGPSNARLQRRASAGVKGGDAQPVYPHVGLVQVGIWLKLRILLPLLPMVYADKEPDSKKNMRAILAYSLLQLALSPYVHAPLHMLRPSSPCAQQHALDAAVRAVEVAGESVLDRLLSVLQAVVSGHWAAWLRGSRSKLREVPVHEGCAALAAEVQAQPHLPQLLKTKLLSCLPLKLRMLEVYTPCAAPPGAGLEERHAPVGAGTGKASTKTSRTIDPWIPLEVNSNVHGSALGGCVPTMAFNPLLPQPATQLVAGAIRRRRTKLTYAAD